MFHLEPQKGENYPLETALVHLSSLLAKADDGEGVFDEGPLTANPSVLTVTGLSPEDCASIRKNFGRDSCNHEAGLLLIFCFKMELWLRFKGLGRVD